MSACEEELAACAEHAAGAELATVVVVTDGETTGLARCVESVLAGDHEHCEVIVVDNHPGDPRTREWVVRRRAADARLRYLPQRLPGFSRARNTGLAFSRGELVAFLDDDVVVETGWLRALTATLLDSPDVACVVGLTAAAELDAPNAVPISRRFNPADPRGDAELYEFVGLSSGWGANFAVRKSALGDLWAFDTSLGRGTPAGGAENLDRVLDLFHRGHGVAFEPRARVTRVGGRATSAVNTALAAMLTKQLLVARGHRRQLLAELPRLVEGQLRRSPGGGRLASARELAGGPFAYARGRLRHSWMTA